MQEKFGVESELVKLSGGCFEVYSGDELVFSKNKLDRFPSDGEVAELLEALA